MEFVMGSGGCPPGNYAMAEFVGTEDLENQYGKAIKLRWRIVGGPMDGQEATRICSPSLSQKSALGKLACQLKGAAISIGERFRFADFVGVRGSLIVEPTQTGGGRVAAFLRAPAASPPPAWGGMQSQPAWRPEAPQQPQPPQAPQPPLPQPTPQPTWGQPEQGTVRF